MCPARFLIPVFPTDADDGVPDTVEDYFPPNQEACFHTTQADMVLTPNISTTHTGTKSCSWSSWGATGPQKPPSLRVLTDGAVAVVVVEKRCLRPSRRRHSAGPSSSARSSGKRFASTLRSRNSGGQVGSATVCPPGCWPMDWEPDISTTETNPSLSSTISVVHNPNPHRALLEALEEIRSGSGTLPRARTLCPVCLFLSIDNLSCLTNR